MSDPKKTTWKQAALNGAVASNAVAFVAAYDFGLVIGCSRPMPDGARAVRGLQGASNAIASMIMVYVFTLGIVPMIVSGFGAWIGIAVFSRSNDDDSAPPTA